MAGLSHASIASTRIADAWIRLRTIRRRSPVYRRRWRPATARQPRLRGLLANTALLAGGTIAIALPLGALLGIVIGKIDVPGRRLIGWTMAALLFVPLYVQAAAWNAVLGAGGWIPQALADGGYANPWLAGWRGAIWVHAMGAVPWVALMTAASLRTVERRLEEESLLDASPFRVLLRVTLRRGLGGVLAAAVWIAVICATEIAVTDLFQIRTFAEEIYTEASLGGLTGESSRVVTSDLAIGVALVAMLVGLALRLIWPWLPKAASIAAEAAWQWRPTRGRLAITTATLLLFAATTLVPLAGLAWKAGIAVHQRGERFERSWSAAKADVDDRPQPLGASPRVGLVARDWRHGGGGHGVHRRTVGVVGAHAPSGRHAASDARCTGNGRASAAVGRMGDRVAQSPIGIVPLAADDALRPHARRPGAGPDGAGPAARLAVDVLAIPQRPAGLVGGGAQRRRRAAHPALAPRHPVANSGRRRCRRDCAGPGRQRAFGDATRRAAGSDADLGPHLPATSPRR